MIFWTRARIWLTAVAATGGLVMVYEGLFEIQKIPRLACPLTTGCESVASAAIAYPGGFAHGLLVAALMGLICAAAQGRERGARVALVVLSDVAALAAIVRVGQMFQLGAQCSWCWLWAACALATAALSIRCLREQQSAAPAASAPATRSAPEAEAAPKP